MSEDIISEPVVEKVALKEPNTKKLSPKKRHVLRNVLVVLGLMLVVLVLVAGWFGLMPGVSKLFGATNARDLGVTYTEADMKSYLEKTSITFANFTDAPENPNRPGKKLIFGDPKTVEGLTLTESELTAAVNNLDWKSMPLANVQVKLSNGSVEVSGNLQPANVSGFIKFIGGVGYSQQNVDKAVSWAQRFLSSAPVYVKAEMSAQNDQLSFRLQQASVGRVSIPQDIAANVLRTGLMNAIQNADNYEIKSASFSDGNMHFSGTYPTTVYVAH